MSSAPKTPEQRLKRHTILILSVAFASFFALGLPDGAFSVAWDGIAVDLGLMLSQSGIIIVANQLAYAFAGSMLGRLYRRVWLEDIDLLGTVVLALGFLGMGLAPNFPVLVAAAIVAGLGAGLIDSSINTYMTQFFSARHMNWMYSFWGVGSTVSPLVMSQMMLIFSWRTGYFAFAAILGVVSIAVLISLFSGIWKSTGDIEAAKIRAEADGKSQSQRRGFLTKKWHQAAEILICFIYGGMDYGFVFFTTQIMAGRSVAHAGMFTVVYYFAMMLGRMFFGWLAGWWQDMRIIRAGLGIAAAGVVIVMLTGNIGGMALAGFGFAPVFPSLLHDSSNRFAPPILSRLVGYEIAAFGAGTAAIFLGLSVLLSHVQMETLFPIILAFVVAVFLLNELLDRIRRG